MYQFNASQDRLCPSKQFESQHWVCSPFNVSVILFHKVVQVLALPDGHPFFFWFVGVECSQRCPVGATFIDSDHFGFAVVSNGLAKKA